MSSVQEYRFYDESAAKRVAELSVDGMLAVYIYSPAVYADGRSVRYDKTDRTVRTVAIGGVPHAPLSFFTDFLGARLELSGDEAVIELNGTSARMAIAVSYGKKYLPIEDAARALSLSAKSYCEDRLTIVGKPLHIAAFDADKEMQTAASYLVFGGYDPYSFKPEDYKAARQNMRVKLVGSQQLNNIDNPSIKKKIDAITKNARNKWETMNKGADRVILWGDKPPVESEELSIQYGALRAMARAWGTYGSELYQNKELHDDILHGVEWMYENMYGEAEIAGTGWRDAHLFNWYFWYISAPDYLTDIFFIMEDSFTLEEKRKYLKCFEWCSTFMRHWFSRDAALSRILVSTKVGIACDNPDRLYAEYVDFDMLLGLEETAEGPHVDYVQWTHGMPYNNAYGKLNLDRVLYIASTLAGTPVEFTNPKQYNQFMLIKYMFEPAMYGGQSFVMFCGRSTFIREGAHGGAILGDMLQMYGMFGEEEDNYIRKLIKRNATTDAVINAIKSTADFRTSTILDDILSDTTLSSENDYEYAHAWFTGDRAAQHRNNYAVGIAMSSKREMAYESINSANKTGWYTGDGATYLYTAYDRNQYDGDNFIVKNINVAYRYPGTTEDSRERVARSINSARAWRPSKSFAGGMQIDDKYIVAAMDFESHSYDGPDDMPDDSGYGGGLPVHINDLHAKKAWFCFDDEIICLGADITSSMDSFVHTTVEHRRIVSPESDNQYLDGVLLPKESYEKRDTGASVVNMEGHAGFVCLDEKSFYVNRYVCDEADGQSFFEVGIDHGKNPTASGYAYAILPYSDNERLAAYKSNPDVTILSNNSRLQAVRENNLALTCYAFHAPADFDGICVDAPCLLSNGNGVLSVSDPSHELEKLTIIVWREIEITEKSPNMTVLIRGGRTTITLDLKGANGRKFELKYIPWINDMKYYVDYTNEDYDEFVELTKDGAAALFLYSNSVMRGGQRLSYSEGEKVRAIGKNGIIYAPVSFFEDILGVSCAAYRPVTVGGVDYLPAIDTARGLGFAAEAFYENRLVVVGKPHHIEAMHKNPALEEAGAYAVYGDYDASGFTHEDYKHAKDEWRLRLIGSPELNDLSDEDIAAKIKWTNTKCKRALDALNRTPDRVILFGDKPPVESDDLWQQYISINAMACAWGMYGSDYYRNADLLADILDCLEWMYENMYGEAEIAGTGWRNVREFNWWHWYVGAPDELTDTMLIIEDHLTMEQKERYLKCYKWILTIMYNAPKDKGGASGRIKSGTKCALLLEDGDFLEGRQMDCDSITGFNEYGSGVHKADYVNWTHSCPHNISYGVEKLKRELFVMSILSPTALDFSGPKRYNQFNLIRYCFEPAMYRTQGFMMFSGRSTFGVESDYGITVLANTLAMIGCYGEDEDLYLKRFIRRHVSGSPTLAKKIKNQCNIYDCAKLKSILADDSIPSDNSDYTYAHAWFTGDRAAQHRADYAIGIAMSSEREKAYECINGANKTGWYTGDGATYLYTTYDGNQYDGKNFINNVNVAYRFPGTTEDSQPRVARSIRSEREWYPEKSFAGSMQIDDKYIVAAMDFGTFHFEGPDDHPDDYGYGAGLPIHHNDLSAKKAWFCLDGDIVCLGAGITSTMDSPVHTTVEHRRIVSPDSDEQYLDGALLPKENYEKRCTGASFVNMKGHAGFVFMGDGEVYLRRYACEATDGQFYLEIGIDHGKNPTGAGYAYAILPYATNEAILAYKNGKGARIISNTDKLQAISDDGLGIACYVFYEAGECNGIKVDKPCILTLESREGEFTLSVTDPTHKLDSITVSLDRRVSVISKSYKIEVSELDEKSVFAANVFMAHGRKFEVKFK